MTLQTIHRLAHDYMASKPYCAEFMVTLKGVEQKISAPPELDAQSSNDATAPIGNIGNGVSNCSKPLVEAFLAGQSSFDWWNAYTLDDPAGKGFVERTAGCMLTGRNAPFTSQSGCSGFFYLQPNVEYAAHAHEPREIYVILSGRARFWDSDIGWREARAGDVVHMASMIWHAMETREEPVLILWAWIGDNLGNKPIFKDKSGALPS